MDFFARQEKAYRKTRWLVAYFIASILAMVAGIYAIVVAIFVIGMSKNPEQAASDPTRWWAPEVLLGVAAAVTGIVLLGSLYKTLQLRSGGDAVALSMGGRRVLPNTEDFLEKRLMNVVEEMAIASGVPVPATYVLDQEQGINAFAAGWSSEQAVVAVNRGTLQYLSRDELQGVVAHEFSHILNGDMRLNIRLIGLLHGVFLVSMVGYYLLRATGGGQRREKNKGAGQIALLGLAVYMIGLLGMLFGRIIQARVSREREYLADASAVQFTRNPNGIAGALKKIGGLIYGSRVRAPQAETAAHMFFGNAVSRLRSGLFATHPPLVKRIRAIDPTFDGKFPRVEEEPASPPDTPEKSRAAKTAYTVRLPGIGDKLPVDPIIILGAAGAPTEQHVHYSQTALEEIPAPLLAAARQPFEAQSLAMALLLDDDPLVREQQLSAVEHRLGKGAPHAIRRLLPHIDQLTPSLVLPLVEIIQGTLRELTPQQFSAFREAMHDVIEADRQLTLFEFVLHQMLVEKVGRNYSHRPRRAIRYRHLEDVQDQAVLLLRVLADAGHSDRQAAATAFARSTALLGLDGSPEWQPVTETEIRRLGDALQDLSQASPSLKQRILRAAIECAGADGVLHPREAELLRAISDAMDVPLPPILPTSTSAPA